MKKELKKPASAKSSGLARGEIVIYQSADRKVRIDVNLDQETVWLSQKQMSLLFKKDVKTINEHIKNIYTEKELDKNPTIWKSQIVQKEGSRTVKRDIDMYNLDVTISVGYRVKSLQGTKFRIWATNTLKSYLTKGYAINEKRLLEANNKFNELKSVIDLLQKKSGHELLVGQEQEILSLLGDYSKTLTLLEQYDKDKVAVSKKGKTAFVLDYVGATDVIGKIKTQLVDKKEASEFFGQQSADKLQGILGNLLQTFDRKELYPSIEEKAANLLYFIIKDHPFIDGNKRIGSFLFAYFLDKNNYAYKETGEKKINDNALTALTLLIAVSNPNEKDKLVKIVTNLLSI